jgi:hypothetical protein
MISSGSACRPVARFEKTSSPSSVTSKTPPPDSISSMSASGNSLRMLASSLEARGR